jgi:hypothetical protein
MKHEDKKNEPAHKCHKNEMMIHKLYVSLFENLRRRFRFSRITTKSSTFFHPCWLMSEMQENGANNDEN